MALSHWNLSGANFRPMNACTQTRSAAPLNSIQIFRLRQCEGNTSRPNKNVSILQQTNVINLTFNDVPVCEERPTFMEFTPNKSLAVIKKKIVFVVSNPTRSVFQGIYHVIRNVNATKNIMIES